MQLVVSMFALHLGVHMHYVQFEKKCTYNKGKPLWKWEFPTFEHKRVPWRNPTFTLFISKHGLYKTCYATFIASQIIERYYILAHLKTRAYFEAIELMLLSEFSSKTAFKNWSQVIFLKDNSSYWLHNWQFIPQATNPLIHKKCRPTRNLGMHLSEEYTQCRKELS